VRGGCVRGACRVRAGSVGVRAGYVRVRAGCVAGASDLLIWVKSS
jgi:hypothetical protein